MTRPLFKHGKAGLEELIDAYDGGYLRLLDQGRSPRMGHVRGKAAALFNAITRGMPVAPMILWETDSADGGRYTYLVDGVHRFLCLHDVLTFVNIESRLDLYWDLTDPEPRTQRWTEPGRPPVTWLPLRSARHTIMFLRHMRLLSPADAALEERAQDLAMRLKSTVVPTLTVTDGDRDQLNDALISFNSH